jgi:hypothetical protein
MANVRMAAADLCICTCNRWFLSKRLRVTVQPLNIPDPLHFYCDDYLHTRCLLSVPTIRPFYHT